MRELDGSRTFMREVCPKRRMGFGETIELGGVARRALAIFHRRDGCIDAFMLGVAARARCCRSIRAIREFCVVSGECHRQLSFRISISLLLTEAVAGDAGIRNGGALEYGTSPAC